MSVITETCTTDQGDAFLAAEPDTSEMALPMGAAQEDGTCSLDSSGTGEYIELCSPQEMSKMLLDERQRESMTSTGLATMRVYVSAASKRAVVAKEDDLLTKKDIADNPRKVADALCTEFKTWPGKNCFMISDVSNA